MRAMESASVPESDSPSPLATDDPDGWGRLIHAIGLPSLRVYIRSRLGAALAKRVNEDDVLQEALLLAWRDRGKCEWRGLRAFRRWILQVIENRIRKLAEQAATLRRGGAEVTLPFSSFESASTAPDRSDAGLASRIGAAISATPSRDASEREEAAAIEETLRSLPDELRDVVRLRLIEELEMEEVAARVGIGISAAYHRFRRGLELYRGRLRHLRVSCSRAQPPESGVPAPAAPGGA